MKIIAICGGSAAGKSTTANNLKNILPNAIVIDGDKYMHVADKELAGELDRAFRKEKNDNVHIFNYLFESYENSLKWIDIIGPRVNELIENEIKENADKDFIIIDWAYIFKCEVIKKCDYIINIKADTNITEKRLHDELQQSDNNYIFFTDESVANRAKYTVFEEYDSLARFSIINNGKIDDLIANCKDIAYKIINCKL